MILFLPHKGIIGSNGLLAPRKVNLALTYIYFIYICVLNIYIHTHMENILQEGVMKAKVQKLIRLCEIFFMTWRKRLVQLVVQNISE